LTDFTEDCEFSDCFSDSGDLRIPDGGDQVQSLLQRWEGWPGKNKTPKGYNILAIKSKKTSLA
jgi:hypothetical protein